LVGLPAVSSKGNHIAIKKGAVSKVDSPLLLVDIFQPLPDCITVKFMDGTYRYPLRRF
jgi:hypothetical protein